MHKLQQALTRAIEQATSVVVVGHREPDGDALGATLGLVHVLGAMGKRVVGCNEGPIPEEYRFLPGLEQLLAGPPGWEAELGLLLDCHQPERAGKALGAYLEGLGQVGVVDHHEGEPSFGTIRWVETTMSATSEMLAILCLEAGWPVGKEAASCFFVGIQTDTGSFRYSNTTAQCLHTAAELVERGADVWGISQQVYATRPRRLKLLGRVMEGLELREGGKLAVGVVRLSEMRSCGCGPQDLEQAVEMLRGIPGVEVAVLLRELNDGGVKASLRSRGKVNVAAVALEFGGGGHRNAAGMRLDMGLEQAREVVVRALEAALREAGA